MHPAASLLCGLADVYCSPRPSCSGSSQGGSHCLGRKADNTAVMVPCSEGYEHVSFETPDTVPVATVRQMSATPLR